MADEELDAYRLVVHQRTKLDLIREAIPKPPGGLPQNSFATWEAMDLEQKLPLIPAPEGALYYSRGKLGQSLLRKGAAGWTSSDPLNRERIPSNKYENMHDKANKFERNAEVQKALKKFKMLNEDGDAICSLSEFNRFRKYLSTLHKDQIKMKLEEMDSLAAVQREINRTVRLEEQYGESRARRASRTEKAQRFRLEKEDYRHKSFEQHQRLVELSTTKSNSLLQQQRADKVKAWEDKMELTRQRVREMEEEAKEKSRMNLQRWAMKSMNAAEFKKNKDEERKAQQQEKASDWFNQKTQAALDRVAMENYIREECAATIKEKSAKRQKRFERLREEIPMRIEMKKAAALKLENIVRKYAMRWLNRVRERLYKNKPDEKHASLWYSGTKDGLKDCIKDLYYLSGYEKLDDVVMNIMKFKEALKKQMLLEEGEDEDEWDE